MNEIEESLNRLASILRQYVPAETDTHAALLAICDALVEIAAVLPAPYTVPKE